MSNSTKISSREISPGEPTRFEQELSLGDQAMDSTHREFVSLAESAATAPADKLAPALQQLVEHTREHFQEEESRMQTVNHRLLPEHRAEHQRILGDMERLCQRAEKGRGAMARAWVADNLMEWFSAHARTMDSAMVADLAPRKLVDEPETDH